MNSKYKNICKILAAEQMVSMGISGSYETLAGTAPLMRNSPTPQSSPKKKVKKHYDYGTKKKKIPIQ